MPESGVRLTGLTLQGIPQRARDVLRLRGVTLAATGGPALVATLSTPLGDVTLASLT
jgi:hypothetical protein